MSESKEEITREYKEQYENSKKMDELKEQAEAYCNKNNIDTHYAHILLDFNSELIKEVERLKEEATCKESLPVQSTQSDLSKIKVDDNGKVLDEPERSSSQIYGQPEMEQQQYEIRLKQYRNTPTLTEWIEAKNKRVEELEHYQSNSSLNPYYTELKKANEQIQKLKEGIIQIESLCDSQNESHKDIWYIAFNLKQSPLKD